MAENLNLKTIETVDTRPFRKLVMTIGELPTSFIESMTYYELLAWFVNYLETVIIPTVNNNAEAVEELQGKFTDLNTAFNTLKSWIEDYFDNLDVQEEINNKLDQMAQDGTLEEIITEYIKANVAWTFDTVADMKLATNLINGGYAQTLGFYAINDGGASIYKITDTGTANEMDVIAIGDLFANLVLEDTMNVRQFGAKGDGVNDDTANIQQALDTCSNVLIPSGTYMIDTDVALLPKSGNKITLDNQTILKAITNDLERYHIFNISFVNDVEISGGTLQGDRDTHTGLTGEWGYCIKVQGTSDNIYLHDIYLLNAWGDGLCVDTTGSVKTERLHINNARRNGLSIIQVESFISNDDFIENTNGTAPQCGVDIEPDLGTQKLNNVVFNNLHTKNNANVGFQCWLKFENTNLSDNIIINNLFSENDLIGLWFESFKNHNGRFFVNEPKIVKSGSRGIYLRNRGLDCSTVIYKPVIDTYGVTNANSHGVDIEGYNFGESTDMGNITIIEPTVINGNASSTNPVAIQCANTTNVVYKNVNILNPIDLDGKYINFNTNIDGKIIDGYNSIVRDVDADTVVGGNEVPFITKTTNYTLLRQIRVSGSVKFPIGTRLKFINTGDYGLKVYFQNQYIYGITNNVNKVVTSTDKGAYLEIERISDTAWTVVSSSGSFTTN